ncbi:hypothetical protein [Prosthecobacter sp.]|uniref:hypothetical protein n=1 Tax=Prosthecobacter sp. TaxID=1965333 RepID=UPI0037843A0A
MVDQALLVLRSVAALFVFVILYKTVRLEGRVLPKAIVLVFAAALFLWLCTLSAWSLWLLALASGLFLVLLVGRVLSARTDPSDSDEAMRRLAETKLPRPYTAEEIQMRRKFSLEDRECVYQMEFVYGRLLSEDEMRENLDEHHAMLARVEADRQERDRKRAAENEAEEKLRREMELPEQRGAGSLWNISFDAGAEFRRVDGTVLTVPGGSHELSLCCRFEAEPEADYYPKIPSELRFAGMPDMSGVINLVSLLDLFEVGQVFWWRDQGDGWQKSFVSNVVLGNVGCVDDAKEVLRFKAGTEEIAVYFRRGSYFASLAVVENQLWARIYALQCLPLEDDDAEFETLAPFCFPIRPANLPEAWNREEDLEEVEDAMALSRVEGRAG